MDKKIKQIREAIKERLDSGDEVFEECRTKPGPYAKQLLSYFTKIVYPGRSFRAIAKLTGLNYMSVYQYYYKTQDDIETYLEVRDDVDFLFYKLGIKNIYKDRIVKDLRSEVFLNTNGERIARLIKEATGLDIKHSRGLKNKRNLILHTK